MKLTQMTTTTLSRVAIVGATGPAGWHLARTLRRDGVEVRAIARRESALAQAFGTEGIDWRAGDARDCGSLLRATEGCDFLVDCIGLPAAAMQEHAHTARTLADVIRRSGARCLHVSSYWSYLPIRHLPIDEMHPRAGGPPFVRMRREAEDILEQAGAAIAQLPDFYGPRVHVSTLQQPLAEAAAGKAMHWIGSAEVSREYSFLPDGMASVAGLMRMPGAFGQRWIVPAAGALRGTDVLRS